MPAKWHDFLNVRDNITNILTVNEDRIGNQVESKEVHKQQEGYHYKSYGDINADNIYMFQKKSKVTIRISFILIRPYISLLQL